MKQLILITLLSFSLSAVAGSNGKNGHNNSLQSRATFTNPIIGADIADPTVIKINDIYFMAGTSSEWAPYYPTYSSKDLVNWTQVGHIFEEKPEWTLNSFWAPELYYLNGKVYCYYTARKASDGISAIGVAIADSYTSEFVDYGIIIEHDKEAIDAFIFEDDGQLYISWKAYGLDSRPIEILASKLSADGLRLEGESFTMLRDDDGIGMEGQAHYKFGDYYYLIYSARSCCGFESDYDVRVARAKDFKGPYEDYSENPIIYGGKNDFISIGHGTMVTTEENRHYYLCHGYVNGPSRYLGRQPVLQEIVMNDKDWLVAKKGPIAELTDEVPYAGTLQEPHKNIKDNFKNKTIDVSWTWNYPFYDVKAQTKKGKLFLSGTPIKDSKTGTVLCKKPQTPEYYYETQVTDKNNGFSGLTMYGDDKNLVAWGTENGVMTLKYINDGKEEILFSKSKEIKKPEFKIEVTEGHLLTFYYKNKNKQWVSTSNESIDVTSLAPWDRTFRAGLIHNGASDEAGEFSYFHMINK